MELSYKFLLFFLALIHALESFLMSSLPFLFLDPKIECKSEILTFENCEIIISDFISIISEFQLYFDKKFWKPILLMSCLLGMCISCIFLTFYTITPKKRGKFLIICMMIGAVIEGFATFVNNLYLLSICLIFGNIFCLCFYSNIYTYVNEIYDPSIRKILPSIFSSSYGIGTMIFVCCTRVFGDWRNLMFYYFSFPVLFLGSIVLIMITIKEFPPKIEEDALLNINIIENMEKSKLSIKQILENGDTKRNALIYIILYSVNIISFSGTDIALGSIGVNLRYSLFCMGLVQAVCSAISGFLLIKFNSEVLIKYTFIWMSFFLLAFFFENKWFDSNNSKIIFSLCIIFANFSIEINWSLIVNLMQNYTPPSLHQNIFSLGLTLSTSIGLILPYYIETMEFVGINPIFGFGILTIIGRVSIEFLGKKYYNGESDLKKCRIELE